MTVHVYTVAIDVEKGEPSTQQIADLVASYPPLEGDVNVMSDMIISDNDPAREA